MLPAKLPGAAAPASPPGVDLDLSEGAPGGLTVRLFEGEILCGALRGTRVLLKQYPHPRYGAADALAANELAAHAALQSPPARGGGSGAHVTRLLGGFVTQAGASAGEQWLVFEGGTTEGTAADYAQLAASQQVQQAEQVEGAQQAQQAYTRKVLRHVLRALAFMHGRLRLHGSLGPEAVALRTLRAAGAAGAQPTGGRPLAVLGDLAVAVDVSDEALWGGPTLGELWDSGSLRSEGSGSIEQLASALWVRARTAGAWSEAERRAFGMADDVAAAGWLVLYLAFVALCPSADWAALQRLVSSAFAMDLAAAREYLEADEALAAGAAFLGGRGGAGWALAAAMLHPDWRRRPSAAECEAHAALAADGD